MIYVPSAIMNCYFHIEKQKEKEAVWLQCYQLRNKNLITSTTNTTLDYLVVYMSENEKDYALKILSLLRKNEIKSDIYTESGKFKSKMNYADKIGVKNIIIVGEDEKAVNELVVKNMITGKQEKININDIEKLK